MSYHELMWHYWRWRARMSASRLRQIDDAKLQRIRSAR